MNNPILIDTVILYNFIGEVNDRATYQLTTLENCYCPLIEGADINNQGKKGNDRARLYIFDEFTKARDDLGHARTYLPHQLFENLPAEEKVNYWTLNDKGDDYFIKLGSENKLKLNKFAHKVTGSPRMWHWEVDGL